MVIELNKDVYKVALANIPGATECTYVQDKVLLLYPDENAEQTKILLEGLGFDFQVIVEAE